MLSNTILRQAQLVAPRVSNFCHLSRTTFVRQRYFVTTSALHYCDSTDKNKKKSAKELIDKLDEKDTGVPTLLSGKYEIFTETNAPIILDIEEEREIFLNKSTAAQTSIEQDSSHEFETVDLTRGQHGVFDVEQLVELLQSDGALDLFVAQLPEDLRYADHLVIVTGRSGRHRKALSQLVRRVFKKKRLPTDLIPRIEGDHEGGSNLDWIALDLGNIVLHIFARAARVKYDLESLWTLGSKYDLQSVQTTDPLHDLLTSHSEYLGDLEPAEPKSVGADGTFFRDHTSTRT